MQQGLIPDLHNLEVNQSLQNLGWIRQTEAQSLRLKSPNLWQSQATNLKEYMFE